MKARIRIRTNQRILRPVFVTYLNVELKRNSGDLATAKTVNLQLSCLKSFIKVCDIMTMELVCLAHHKFLEGWNLFQVVKFVLNARAYEVTFRSSRHLKRGFLAAREFDKGKFWNRKPEIGTYGNGDKIALEREILKSDRSTILQYCPMKKIREIEIRGSREAWSWQLNDIKTAGIPLFSSRRNKV